MRRLPLGAVGTPNSSTDSTPVFSARTNRSNANVPPTSPPPQPPQLSSAALSAMSEEDLLKELARLEQENSRLESVLATSEEAQHQLVAQATHLQQSTEVEEESMSLSLMRKLDSAQRDVKQYKRQIRDEEVSHKKLRSQIEDVKRQQIDMENQLEQEQEFVLWKLQKQVNETQNRKMEKERELAQERMAYLEILHTQLRRLISETSPLSLSAKLAITTPRGGRPRSDSQLSTSSTFATHSRSVTPHMSLLMSEPSLSTTNPLADSALLESPVAPLQRVAPPHSSPSSSTRTGGNNNNNVFVDPTAGLPSSSQDHHLHTPQPNHSSDLSPLSVAAVGRPRASSRASSVMTPTSRSIADLERTVNELLVIQAEFQSDAKQNEERCIALTERLHELHQKAFLDSAKASKMQEDLRKAKHDLELLQSASTVATNLSSSSHQRTFSEDSSAASSVLVPLHVGSMSLRDRTKELLSTPRVNLSNPRRQRGGSQVSTTRSISPPAIHSGYTSGVETSSRVGVTTRPAPPPGATRPAVVRPPSSLSPAPLHGPASPLVADKVSSRSIVGVESAEQSLLITDPGAESDRSLCMTTPEHEK